MKSMKKTYGIGLKITLMMVMVLSLSFIVVDKDGKNKSKVDKEKEITLKREWSEKHRESSWYLQMKASEPNFYEVRSMYNAYFANRPYIKTHEVKAFNKFTETYFPNIDAEGYYIKPEANSIDGKIRIKAEGEYANSTTPWSQMFLKWNTTQDNGGTGVLRSIRVNPSSPTNVLAGAVTAGIWRTIDSGENWIFASGGVPEVEWVNEIVFSRGNPNIVYAGTDMGIIKSIDGGVNWSYTGLSKNFPNKYGNLVWVDVPNVNSGNTVYATTQEGSVFKIHKSTNGGTSWLLVYQTNQTIWDMRVKPDDESIIYIIEKSATTEWGNFKRSTDGGQSFTTISSGYPADHNTPSHRSRLATTPANTNVVYIATGYNGGGVNDKISFFKSSDGGLTFTKKCCGNAAVPLENAVGSTDFLSGTAHLAQLTWNFAFTVSESDENFLACAANKLKISTDGGNTWAYDRTGSVVTGSQYDNYASNNAHTGVHGDHHGLSIVGNHIWNANDGGAYYSSDGGMTVVKDKSDGLGIQELWGFGQSFKNDIMAVGLNHNQICFRDDTVYGGWIGVNGADAMAANVNPINDEYMYTHPWGHERVKRSLTGKTGHEFLGLGIELGYLTFDNLEFHPNLYYTIYGSDYGDRNKSYRLAKTTNNADSWSVINSFVDVQKNAVAVKVSFANPDYVYAVVEPNRVIKSTDGGSTWAEVGPPASLHNNLALWRLAVSDTNPDHIWVTVKGHQATRKVLHSTDGGTTWLDYSAGLPSNAIYSMIYQRGSNDILYVGTRLGVYYRKGNMSTWQKFGTGFPSCNASFIFINYAKGKIRLGTSRGLWENDLVELTPPKANISADRALVTGDHPQVQFADYSVVDMNATYQWTFPGGVPATSTEERPLVSYADAYVGSYDVTLTVTDSRGTNTQTLTNFITADGSDPTLPMTIHYVNSEETVGSNGAATNAIDGAVGTIWHTKWQGGSISHPHDIEINLGAPFMISAVTYLPRLDGNTSGRIGNYEVYVTNDTNNWGSAVATGTWGNTSILKEANFTPTTAKYIRLRALSEVNGGAHTAASEINVVKAVNTPVPALSIHYVDSEETVGSNSAAANAIDGNNTSIWHTQWQGGSTLHPHDIQINLGAPFMISALTYLPRQDGNENGRVANYEVYISNDPNNWGSAVSTGTWENTSTLKSAYFTPTTVQYIRLKTLSAINGSTHASAAEINVVQGEVLLEPALTVHYVDSEQTSGYDAINAIDGLNNTMWHTGWSSGNDSHPHEIQLNLGATFSVSGLTYLPRQDGGVNGRVAQYEIYVSDNPSNWGSAVATGTWTNDSVLKTVNFTAKMGKYLRLVSLSEVNGNLWTAAAEIDVITTVPPITSQSQENTLNIKSEEIKPFEVNVYPVPFKDHINIIAKGGEASEKNIRILDLRGKVIYEDKIPANKEFTIPTSNISKGIYIIEISGDGYHKNIKIAKGNNILKKQED